MKTITFFIFMGAGLIWPAWLQGQEYHYYGDTHIDDGQVNNRFIVAAPDLKAFCIDSDSAGVRGGFSCPLFSVGPLLRRGLLRFIGDPLGFFPDNPVFREATEMELNPAFTKSSLTSIVFRPLPAILSLFLSQSHGNPADYGFKIRLPFHANFYSEILYYDVPDRKAIENEEWFLTAPAFPGGSLSTVAATIFYGQGVFSASLLSGLSSGNKIRPGYFLVAHSDFRIKPVKWSFLLGVQSDEYFSPALQCPPEKFAAGSSFDLGLPNFKFHAAYKYRFLTDFTLPWPAYGQAHEWALKGCLPIKFEKKRHAAFIVDFKHETQITPQGHDIDYALAFHARYYTDLIHEYQADYALNNENGFLRHRFSTRYAYRAKRIGMAVTFDYQWPDDDLTAGLNLEWKWHQSILSCRFDHYFENIASRFHFTYKITVNLKYHI